eukprot:gene8067-9925_t
MSIGIPVKILHEADSHVITIELKTGELYRGTLIESEDNMNCKMKNITVTARDGRVSQIEQAYLRGSKIRLFILPDMLKNAPMFKRVDGKVVLKGKSLGIGRGRGGPGRGGPGRGGPGGMRGGRGGPVPIQYDIEFKEFHPWERLINAGQPYHINESSQFRNVKYIALGKLYGPESLAFNKKGQMYMALKNGDIRVVEPPFIYVNDPTSPIQNNPETYSPNNKLLAKCGRPLGVHVDLEENVIIADALLGLLKYDVESGDLTILSSQVNGTRLNFVNDVHVGSDGTIYFTNSIRAGPYFDRFNNWNTLYPSFYACFAQDNAGMVLSYSPKTKETKVLAKDFHYANGVSLDLKEESLFVAETATFLVKRVWIKGKKAGKVETFIENLPGYPDGIELGPDNKLYISIFGARTAFTDFLQRNPLLKRIVTRIPYIGSLTMKPPSIVVLDANSGKLLKYLEASTTPMKTITSTVEYNGQIYIGNVYGYVAAHWHLICSKKKKTIGWRKQLQDALSHCRRLFESGADHHECYGFWKLKDMSDPWEESIDQSSPFSSPPSPVSPVPQLYPSPSLGSDNSLHSSTCSTPSRSSSNSSNNSTPNYNSSPSSSSTPLLSSSSSTIPHPSFFNGSGYVNYNSLNLNSNAIFNNGSKPPVTSTKYYPKSPSYAISNDLSNLGLSSPLIPTVPRPRSKSLLSSFQLDSPLRLPINSSTNIYNNTNNSNNNNNILYSPPKKSKDHYSPYIQMPPQQSLNPTSAFIPTSISYYLNREKEEFYLNNNSNNNSTPKYNRDSIDSYESSPPPPSSSRVFSKDQESSSNFISDPLILKSNDNSIDNKISTSKKSTPNPSNNSQSSKTNNSLVLPNISFFSQSSPSLVSSSFINTNNLDFCINNSTSTSKEHKQHYSPIHSPESSLLLFRNNRKRSIDSTL